MRLVIFFFTLLNLTLLAQNSNNITISRFDLDVLNYIKQPNQNKKDAISNKYQNFLPAFYQATLNVEQSKSSLDELIKYFSHPALLQLYTDASVRFDDVEIKIYEKELDDMRLILQQELDIIQIPLFYFHVSGLKENAIYVNNTISLSIDKYLGKDYTPYYKYFNKNQLEQMSSEMITRDFTKAWLMADLIKTESLNGNLLEEIIELGKLFYIMSVVLPHITERQIIGYSETDWNWCVENQKKMWSLMVKNNFLFSSDRQVINSYLGEARGNQSIITKAPHNFGGWIGLQIVKQFVKNSNSSSKALLSTDTLTILKVAKY